MAKFVEVTDYEGQAFFDPEDLFAIEPTRDNPVMRSILRFRTGYTMLVRELPEEVVARVARARI